jgi:two-component system, cell cycle sensor histidine kinase and response regulator CckA
VAITRQDFAQVKDPIRIELQDLAIQSLAETIAVATGFFAIHLPIEDHVLSRETARLVLIFRKEPAGWKISHSSISIPYALVGDGEVYPMKELVERNQFLEELVAQRTAQLSETNTNLQRANEALTKEIAEHQRAQDALVESEAHYRLLTESASDVVWQLDGDFRFTYVSPADQRLRGYRPDEVIGSHIYQLFNEAGIAAIKEAVRQREEAEQSGRSGTITFEAQQRCKDGRWIWSEINSTPQRDASGKITGFHGISREITERKEHEKEMLKIERLESLGALAGGIAHDFNNILSGIMGNLSLAQAFLDATHRSAQPLAEAEKSSVRAAELARQLLTFASGGEPVKQLISLQHLVSETVSLVLRGSNIKGKVEIPDSVHAIKADEGQIKQVIHNIAINAAQAMPEGGTLIVTAQNETLGTENSPALPSGSYVRLSFTDQGCGIADADQNRIFDPYFTTKPSGRGLGLASVHSIVKRHGGKVGVSSAPDKGTTVTIKLPSIGATYVQQDAGSDTPDAGQRVGDAILVMDDEQIIREMTAEMLDYLGYHATTCENGSEAVARYQASRETGHPFAAVILDLTVPGGMGGKEAAQQILGLDPKACLIVSSGYSNDPIMSDYGNYGFSAAIGKPYKLDQFGQLLSSLLPAA